MTRPLRIAVADDEVDMRDFYRAMLPRLGHTVTLAAATGHELVSGCRADRPDLVITDIKMPDGDGIDAAVQLYLDHPLPVILVSAYHDPELIERAEADHVLAYLVKPISQADLEPAIALALRRFEQFEALRAEAATMRQALEDRKLIERAKGIVMRRLNLPEDEAFRYLQKMSNRKNLKMAALAVSILTVADALDLN